MENLSVTANANNQVSGLSYDASGDVLGDGVNTYAWNARREIATAAGVTYTYDGTGNRVEKSSGTIYWYGLGGQVLDETDLSGNLQNEYVYFDGRRIAWRNSGGNVYYYAGDFLGTTRAIVTSSGSVCYDADFYPYGGERAVTDACPQNYKFTGKERDSETGNDYFGARYYAPQSSLTGRFLSPDWSATVEPVPYAKLGNPQTLNLYAYVADNPTSFADPDGHHLPAPNALPQNRSTDAVSGGDQTPAAQQKKASFWQRVKAFFHNAHAAYQKEQASVKAWEAKHPNATALIMLGAMAAGGGEGELGEPEGGDVELGAPDAGITGTPSAPPPTDPATSPGPGWKRRGSGSPGSSQGSRYNPGTGETLHPDLQHGGPIGPHWDYTNSLGQQFRVFSDGTSVPK